MIEKRNKFIILHLLSLFIVLWLISTTGVEFLEKSGKTERISLAKKLNPLKASPYYYSGIIKHYNLIEHDLNSAIKLYRIALSKNPFYSAVWYDLAYAYLSKNKKDWSFSAIENYCRLNSGQSDKLWNIAMFYYVQTNDIDRTLSYLRRYLRLKPDKSIKVYRFLENTNTSPEYIIDNLLSLDPKDFSSDYIGYLIREKKIEDAVRAWKHIDHSQVKMRTKIRLCNLFLYNNRYDIATSLWNELLSNKKEDYFTEGLNNGGFEAPLVNGCMGWVSARKEGVSIRRDNKEYFEGKASLRISFDGRHNVDINAIRQIVILEPGKSYRLYAMIKSEGLTTTNGLFFHVYGFRCKGITKRSRTVTGTNEWMQLSVDFTVPDECRAVVVTLKRVMSHKFNNKIKGRAWIDGLKIIEEQIAQKSF